MSSQIISVNLDKLLVFSFSCLISRGFIHVSYHSHGERENDTEFVMGMSQDIISDGFDGERHRSKVKVTRQKSDFLNCGLYMYQFKMNNNKYLEQGRTIGPLTLHTSSQEFMVRAKFYCSSGYGFSSLLLDRNKTNRSSLQDMTSVTTTIGISLKVVLTRPFWNPQF